MGEDHPSELVSVYRGGGGLPRAELLRSVIEGSGITCFVRHAGAGAVYAVNVGALAEFELFVPQSEAARAAELIEGLDEDIEEIEIDEEHPYWEVEEDPQPE